MASLSSPRASLLPLACLSLVMALSGCSSDDDGAADDGAAADGGGSGGGDSGGGAQGPGFDAEAVADLEASGVGKYLGVNSPSSETTTGDVTEHFFDVGTSGPRCLGGTEYTVLTRAGDSEDLVIYLEGGGACWTGLCAAKMETSHAVPTSGLLDPDAATNVVAGWDVVYVPYCDGSAFLGDSELADASMPGGTRHHRGIRNLSAAIDVALAKFPNPRRILLAGSSAGGYGTITGTGIVRLAYPKTPLIVFNDAGLGLDNPANPGSQIRKDEWKYMQFIPAGCEGCQEDQSLVPAWGLEHDPTLRLAAFSAYEDAVIGATFLGMTGPDFKALLLEKTGAIQALYPDRFRRFLVPGTSHTTLLADAGPSPNGSGIHGFLTVVEGQSVSEWTQAFVDGTAEWTDRLIGE